MKETKLTVLVLMLLCGSFCALNQMTIVIGILMAQLVNYLILQSHPVPEGVEGATNE